MKIKKVIIADTLKKQSNEIENYLAESSYTAPKKFREELKQQINAVEKYPEANSLVRTARMPNKTQQYRETRVMKSWRLIFKLPKATKGLLVFLGIIHKKQNDSALEKLRTRKYDKG